MSFKSQEVFLWANWVNVCVYVWSLSHVGLFATPWAVARQAPLSTEFSRQEYWSGLPFPHPRDLPNPGIESTSPALAGRLSTTNNKLKMEDSPAILRQESHNCQMKHWTTTVAHVKRAFCCS